MSSKLPRGIRNNNPGNIEWGDPWQGLVLRDERTDPRFAQFTSAVFGIRALLRVLITYQDKRRAGDGSKIDTVKKIIERWAPSFENNTDAYIKAVGTAFANAGTDIDPYDDPINVHDYETAKVLVEAIIRHENGKGPLDTPNTWYREEVIEEGLRLAGVVKPTHAVGKIPVNDTTVAATGTGAIGAIQVAEVMPSIVDAIERSDAHLSSGSVVRIIIGLTLIGISVFMAVSQVRKYQSGVIP